MRRARRTRAPLNILEGSFNVPKTVFISTVGHQISIVLIGLLKQLFVLYFLGFQVLKSKK